MSGSRFSSYELIIRLNTLSDTESMIVAAFLNYHVTTDVFVKHKPYSFLPDCMLTFPAFATLYNTLQQLKINIHSIRFESTLVRINQHEFAVYADEVVGAGAYGVASGVCGWLRLSQDGYTNYERVSFIAKHLQARKDAINREYENLNLIKPTSVKGLTFLNVADGKHLEQQYQEIHLKQLRTRQGLVKNHQDQHALLIEERIPGKDLEAILSSFQYNFDSLSIDHRLLLTRNIFRAVNLFHLAGWVHRDLKPANIMLDMNSPLLPVAIIDPGYLTNVKVGSISFVGTLLYASTENHMRNRAAWARTNNTHTCIPPLTCAEDVFSLGVIVAEIMCANPITSQLPGTTDHYKFPELFNGIEVISDVSPALEPNQLHADHHKNLEVLIYKMISPLARNRGSCNDLMKIIERIMLERQLRASPDKSVRMLMAAAKEGVNLREALNKHAYTHQSLQVEHVSEINRLFTDALNKIQDSPAALSLFLDRVGVNVLLAPSYFTSDLLESSTSIDDVILFVNVPRTTHELGLTSKQQILTIVNNVINDYLATCNKLLEMQRKISEVNPRNTHHDNARCHELSASIREVLLDQRPLALDHLVDLLPSMRSKVQSIEANFKDLSAKWSSTTSSRHCGFFVEKKHIATNTEVSPGREQGQVTRPRK